MLQTVNYSGKMLHLDVLQGSEYASAALQSNGGKEI